MALLLTKRGKKWPKDRERKRKLSTRFVRFSRKADALAVHGGRQGETEEIKVHPVSTRIRTYVHPSRDVDASHASSAASQRGISYHSGEIRSLAFIIARNGLSLSLCARWSDLFL